MGLRNLFRRPLCPVCSNPRGDFFIDGGRGMVRCPNCGTEIPAGEVFSDQEMVALAQGIGPDGDAFLLALGFERQPVSTWQKVKSIGMIVLTAAATIYYVLVTVFRTDRAASAPLIALIAGGLTVWQIILYRRQSKLSQWKRTKSKP